MYIIFFCSFAWTYGLLGIYLQHRFLISSKLALMIEEWKMIGKMI